MRKRPRLTLPVTDDAMKQLLYTKYSDWAYEEEYRGFFRLDTRDASGRYFYDFDEKVRLCEVLAGPICATPKAVIDAGLKDYADPIRVVKTRLAFKTFRVVENKRGFRR